MAKRTSVVGAHRWPGFEIEAGAVARGHAIVAGIDEAGRGPWAGPVVAAAVVLDGASLPEGLADSKALDAAARERAFGSIVARATAIGIGVAEVERIDSMNILRATLWAMATAVDRLAVAPSLVLVDGNQAPPLTCVVQTIVKGDASCLSIAAASIVAKVTRDRIMCELAETCPGYGFERHKGYGTPQHMAALKSLGASPHHRRSFKPVRQTIAGAGP